jgi:hypothetical protein
VPGVQALAALAVEFPARVVFLAKPVSVKVARQMPVLVPVIN